ncbi:hypothetical protein FEM03_23260 [Phragmitibacter flavus]|uniref:DUF3592 domain-containing protein n=1 Tax=Phragmitibacter flavus TaxID=2576071 RepID=A0A5R8K7J8_9BACT|nr:hypothetical protein [Phragmitibacter flavus]TLD68324.1 hypothetical protein FEM03_23260 [Phragmitibacter flavus]
MLLAAGIQWAPHPHPNMPADMPVPENVAFDMSLVPYITMGGFVLSALALLFLVRRYLLVKKILTHGETVKGMVESLDVHLRENESDTDTPSTTTYSRSYYVRLSYSWRGADQKIKLKIPNSGFVFGLVKGRETDLMILESKPKKPLIKSVYCGKI